jgi:hypothetical protein
VLGGWLVGGSVELKTWNVDVDARCESGLWTKALGDGQRRVLSAHRA